MIWLEAKRERKPYFKFNDRSKVENEVNRALRRMGDEIVASFSISIFAFKRRRGILIRFSASLLELTNRQLWHLASKAIHCWSISRWRVREWREFIDIFYPATSHKHKGGKNKMRKRQRPTLDKCPAGPAVACAGQRLAGQRETFSGASNHFFSLF